MNAVRAACGFTLVELIIVSALLVLLGGGFLTMFLTGQSSYLSADASIQIQQEARKALDVVVRELREAGAATGSVVTRTGPLPNGSYQLNFQIALGYNMATYPGAPPGGCTTPASICWGGNTISEWVHYVVIGAAGAGVNRQLVRCVNGDAATAIASAAGCRVLANNVNLPTEPAATDTFQLVDANANGTLDTIVVNLQIKTESGMLPGGSQRTQILTSRIRMRNAT